MRRGPLVLGGPILLGSFQAAAEEAMLWRTVGEWQIRIDKTLGSGCFMLASSTRGTITRIGLDQRHLNGYILVGNESWRSLEEGTEYELALQFDNEAPWRGKATARRIGDSRPIFLHLSFNKPDFLLDPAGKQTLTLRYNGKVVTSLPLTGT